MVSDPANNEHVPWHTYIVFSLICFLSLSNCRNESCYCNQQMGSLLMLTNTLKKHKYFAYCLELHLQYVNIKSHQSKLWDCQHFFKWVYESFRSECNPNSSLYKEETVARVAVGFTRLHSWAVAELALECRTLYWWSSLISTAFYCFPLLLNSCWLQSSSYWSFVS